MSEVKHITGQEKEPQENVIQYRGFEIKIIVHTDGDNQVILVSNERKVFCVVEGVDHVESIKKLCKQRVDKYLKIQSQVKE